MSKKYRGRIAEFIKQMAANPVTVKDYYEAKAMPEKFHQTQFRFTFNSNQKERVQELEKSNQFYESAPTDLYHKAFLLRQRQPEKEIGPPKMKFKASTGVE